ncbi:MAG: BMC domain-containing protein [Deltaproteobacteria bacterium]|nr:BMC domain-containing protein [Deltaproteobacteria bacterium]
MAIELRCFTYIDILQPQTASFLATVSRGYMPLERQAALFFEVAPGMDINIVTDIALKRTSCTPGMQIVERQFGCLQLQHYDQGQIRAAGEAVLTALDLSEKDRLKPRLVSAQTITGVHGYHAQITNRMRHGNFLDEGRTLYVMEVHPAGYALIAANEAEKAAKVDILEVISFGAFGRVYLGGDEEEIKCAAEAAVAVLESFDGRPNEGPGATFY